MSYQLGLSVDTGFPLSVEDSMRLIKRTGFDAFFTGWRPDAPIAAYARLAKDIGLIYQVDPRPLRRYERGLERLGEGRIYHRQPHQVRG